MGIKASCWTENFKIRSSAFHLDLLEALSRSLSGSRLSHIQLLSRKDQNYSLGEDGKVGLDVFKYKETLPPAAGEPGRSNPDSSPGQ